MALLKLVLILLTLARIKVIFAVFNMTSYRQMPPLYTFDDYDLCLFHNENTETNNIGGTYCMVYAEIVPNDTSPLWHKIANFSSDAKRHFRHDHLYFGVCLDRCRQLLQPLTKFRKHELAGSSKIRDVELLHYYINVHKRDTDDRVRYEKIISSCLNYEFQRKYALQLRASIEYCENSNTTLELDALEIGFYGLLLCLLLATIFSTAFDYRLKTSQAMCNQNKSFYKAELQTNAQKLLTAFSLCRNYYRIIRPVEHNTQTVADLQFFDAFRIFGVFLVIFAHTLILFMTVQVSNPEFFEQFFYRKETGIIENGAAIIQMFFVMSGFLLYVNFTEQQLITPKTSIPSCIFIYIKALLYRYFRLIPSLLILILFNATVLVRLQDGPFWRHYTEAERTFCREYWWQNLFFINNYLMKESCSHQTWYLAADMQLFELFMITIIVINKYPVLRKFVYSSLLLATFVVPAAVTYFLRLDAIYHSNPESYRYMFFRDAETFYQAYTPLYTNIGGYLFGFLSAELYLKLRRNGRRFHGVLKFELLSWLIIPVAFCILFTGAFFMSYEYQRPSLWEALFAGIYRNVWVLLCCCAVLGMCFRIGWISYEICMHPFFRPLAKISYQSYLWHLVVLRLIGGFYRQPIYINRLYILCHIILVFIMTNIFALFFAIIFEFPFVEITKCLLRTKKDTSKCENTNDTFNLN